MLICVTLVILSMLGTLGFAGWLAHKEWLKCQEAQENEKK